MSKVYLIKNINCFCLSPNKDCCVVELTEDDYGLILDALYEFASQHKNTVMWSNKNKSFSKELIKVAKKFEKIFKE